jgi:Tfp pilus assembly protein PilV
MSARRGLTLMENVLSFTLTGLGIVALLALLNGALFLSARSQQRVFAGAIAQELLETYQPDLAPLPDGPLTLSYRNDQDQTEYRPLLTLSTYSTDPVVRRLEVTVSWSYKGISRSVKRQRLITRLPR